MCVAVPGVVAVCVNTYNTCVYAHTSLYACTIGWYMNSGSLAFMHFLFVYFARKVEL